MICSLGACQMMWTVNAMLELMGTKLSMDHPTLWCDDEPAIALISNSRIYPRSKYIANNYQYEWEKAGHEFVVKHVATTENLVGICTKALLMATSVKSSSAIDASH